MWIVEYDADFDCWCCYHTETEMYTGFYRSEAEAEARCEELNSKHRWD